MEKDSSSGFGLLLVLVVHKNISFLDSFLSEVFHNDVDSIGIVEIISRTDR